MATRVTDWPSLCVKQWKASGATATQLMWLKHGYPFDFAALVPPIGMQGGADGNHPGCEEHAGWMHEVFVEFIELGVVSEIPHVPYCTNPLNCIPKAKADWDPLDLKLRHMLIMLVDQRPINEYLRLRTQRFRNEKLHRARGIIETGDVVLQ